MAATRKPNQRSSIYLGSDGRWHGWVTMGTKSDGTPDRRHRTGKTEAEVTRKVRDLEDKRRAGQVANAGRTPSVEQWLRLWLDTIAPRRVRASTLAGYRSKVEHRLIPGLGGHRLDRLQPEHVEAFYTALESEGLAGSHVLQIHRILSRSLKVAVQRGRVARNVCLLVDPPKMSRRVFTPLTEAAARDVLAAARERRNGARWSVALAIGLRQGEALGLQWRHVDLDGGDLDVVTELQRLPWRHGCGDPVACSADRHTSRCAPGCVKHASRCPKRRGGGLVLEEPKSRTSRRRIALPVELAAQLREHRAAQLAERLAAGPGWLGWTFDGAPVELVFCQPDGRPIDPRADWAAWKALLADVGAPDVRVHDARHTAATLLLEQGVPARVVMEVLGHSSIQLTAGTYQHVTDRLAREAADAMGSALWGGTATTTATGTRGRRRLT